MYKTNIAKEKGKETSAINRSSHTPFKNNPLALAMTMRVFRPCSNSQSSRLLVAVPIQAAKLAPLHPLRARSDGRCRCSNTSAGEMVGIVDKHEGWQRRFVAIYEALVMGERGCDCWV